MSRGIGRFGKDRSGITKTLTHPMGEGEAAPAFEENRIV